jgi:hypothetical protein
VFQVYSSGTPAQWLVLGLYIFWPVLVPILIAIVLGVAGITIVSERERDRKRRDARSADSSIKGSLDRGD